MRVSYLANVFPISRFQFKEAKDGEQNVATEQTVQSKSITNDDEKVGNLNDEIAEIDAKKRKRRPTNGKSLNKGQGV